MIPGTRGGHNPSVPSELLRARVQAGRLVRLGLVLGVEFDSGRRDLVARLADRAGFETVWVADVADIGLVAAITARCEVGGEIRAGRDAELRAALEAARDAAGGRARLLVRGARPGAHTGVAEWLERDGSRLGVVLDATEALRAADGRGGEAVGVAIDLSLSLGRTDAEARARAGRDPAFAARVAADPDAAVVGTLEAGQDRVIALAEAGVTDLRLHIPDSTDVHDVLAQMRPLGAGTLDRLRTADPRSPAPSPPPGWGAPPRPR